MNFNDELHVNQIVEVYYQITNVSSMITVVKPQLAQNNDKILYAEKFISENQSVEYRNLAATGVKVKGADYMDYDSALKWIGHSTSSKPFTDKIEKLLNQQKPVPKIEEVFAGLRKFLEKLGLAIKTEMLPEKFSGTNYAENKAVTELLAASKK